MLIFVMPIYDNTACSSNENIVYRAELKLQITRERANREREQTGRERGREGRREVKKKDRTAVATGEASCKNTRPALLSNSANY